MRVAKRKSTRGRRGLGSITERDGGYLARWSHTEGGKRVRTARTFVLRNDAEWWLAEARRHGEAPDDPLVSEWMPAWLAGKRSIRASTREQYRNHVEEVAHADRATARGDTPAIWSGQSGVRHTPVGSHPAHIAATASR